MSNHLDTLKQKLSKAYSLVSAIWHKHWLLLVLTTLALSTALTLPLLLWRAEKLIDHVAETIFPAPKMALFLKRDLTPEAIDLAKNSLQQALTQTLPSLQIIVHPTQTNSQGSLQRPPLTPTVSPRALVLFISSEVAQNQLIELGFTDAFSATADNPLPHSFVIEFMGLDTADIARLPSLAKIITESLTSVETYRIDEALAQHTVRAHQYIMKWVRIGLVATGISATAVALSLFTTLTLIALGVWRRDYASETDLISPALMLGAMVGLSTSLLASALNDILGNELSTQAQSACSTFGMACPFDGLFTLNSLLSHSGWLLAAAVSGAAAAAGIAMIAKTVNPNVQWEIIE